ncbi:MAG: thiamine ABC transporter substrate binding subunit [Rhizobiales bacterium]|nr:thiamine ABC transporter substrate binding subunit [Hyphomicrobiales bacterium]MBI3673852.1 thiamine ABC transporter substrate binding subunit [Hyphomicrobiales bacterium]
MKKILTALFALFALAVPATARETLTIYTYDSFVSDWGPGAKIKEAFEKTCDCTIKWVAPGDGVAVLNRLKLEGKNTKADVVLGLDTNLTAEAASTGLFGKHGVDLSLARTPVAWTDEIFMPFDFAHFAVVYDSQAIKQPPTSLDELVNGDPTQKIVLEDPRSSTPGLGFLLWMKSVYGDKAGEAWKKLRPRILTTAPGWSDAYALFTKGEAPMVLSYTTSPAYHMIAEKTDRYKAASFSEGHYLQIEVAGLIDASPNRALAQKFLQFMMGPGFQDQIPTNNWMLPAGATSAPLPPAFDTLVKPTKTLLFTPEDVAQNRRAWIDEWLNAMAN